MSSPIARLEMNDSELEKLPATQYKVDSYESSYLYLKGIIKERINDDTSRCTGKAQRPCEKERKRMAKKISFNFKERLYSDISMKAW